MNSLINNLDNLNMNNYWTYDTLKEKVLGNEQTKLVKSINQMLGELGNEEMEIFNNSEYNEETEDYEYVEVYNWVSINEYYTDILEYGGDIIFTEFKGQKWIGIISGNSGWNMDGNIIKLIDILNSQN